MIEGRLFRLRGDVAKDKDISTSHRLSIPEPGRAGKPVRCFRDGPRNALVLLVQILGAFVVGRGTLGDGGDWKQQEQREILDAHGMPGERISDSTGARTAAEGVMAPEITS